MAAMRGGRAGRSTLALAVALVMIAAPAAADLDTPSAAQKQAIYAKSSVVRVVGFWEVTYRLGDELFKAYVGGMGSGFFISSDGFVATNAHVVQDIHNGEDKAKEQAFGQFLKQLEAKHGEELRRLDREQIIAVLDLARRSARAVASNEIVLPDGSKLPYEVRAFGAPVGQGQDVAILKVDIKDAPNLAIGDSDRVSLQDNVLAIGYPGAADMQGLLDSKSQLEATITDGKVSAIKRTTDGEPVLQVTVPITHGNSGGPAINDKGEVIGLATFGSRGEIQGFNFLVASSTLQKFVQQAKANTQPSKTITLWRKALEEMWAGDLDAALADFDEVLTLYPAHSEAPRLIKHVRQLKKEGKGKPKEVAAGSDTASGDKTDSNAAGIAVAIIIVVTLLLIITLVAVKARKRPAPAHGHALHGHAPHGHAPHGHAPHGHAPHALQGMIGGRVGPAGGPAPVAKTVALGQAQHAPVAATAFGSLAMASLTCTRGQLVGQRFSITPTGILIGRQPGVAHVVINDSRASGKHVWIGFENGVLFAIDQGTTNGTFVNDVHNGRISKAPLKDGDTVIVAEPDCLSLTLKLT
jgi:S1-C subfamily serine protease